jgi:cation diffusion facilitator family transporter
MKFFSEKAPSTQTNNQYYKAMTITLSGNVLLAVMKWIAANYSASSALRADAYNSLGDVMYSLLLVVGMYVSMQPPDISHPQGHKRFEPLIGLMISLSIAIAGYRALSGSIEKIRFGAEPLTEIFPIVVLAVSASIKGVMFLLIRRIADKINSPTLRTTALDNITDTISSFTAILGVLGARYLTPLADPIAGILVSIWIFLAAYMALRENMEFITGAGAPEDRREEFAKVIKSVPGVLNVHQLFTEYVGTKYLLDVHINVDGKATLHDVHHIETVIEKRLMELDDVGRVYVHVEPPGYD